MIHVIIIGAGGSLASYVIEQLQQRNDIHLI
jgi:hypothetical protein